MTFKKLKYVSSASDAVIQHRIDRALRLLHAAIVLLDDQNGAGRQPRAEWFHPTGHLNDHGIAYLRSLFESGKSTYAAAKEMGISYRTAAIRRKHWYPEREIIL